MILIDYIIYITFRSLSISGFHKNNIFLKETCIRFTSFMLLQPCIFGCLWFIFKKNIAVNELVFVGLALGVYIIIFLLLNNKYRHINISTLRKFENIHYKNYQIILIFCLLLFLFFVLDILVIIYYAINKN